MSLVKIIQERSIWISQDDLLVTECLLLTGLDEQLLWPDTDMRDVMLSDEGSFNVRV
jgi:hypothetical protein